MQTGDDHSPDLTSEYLFILDFATVPMRIFHDLIATLTLNKELVPP